MRVTKTVETGPNRRTFLVGGTALLASSVATAPAPLAATVERRLSFYHLHTDENIDVPYRIGGSYVPESLEAINHILRDFRTSEIQPIDPRLLDLLYGLRETLQSAEPFRVISGYRSPKTNAHLASRSGGVAKRSLHMQGKAIDIRLPGRRLSHIHKAAVRMRRGGVGMYPKSNFVHLDVGRIRYW